MYVPTFSEIDEAAARAVVTEVGSGWLVTNSAEGPPLATLMPVLWRDDLLIAHLAKANPHWRSIADSAPGLMIVTGPEAYVSPSAKLSQNRSEDDRGGVVEGLGRVADPGSASIAAAMRSADTDAGCSSK